MKKFILTLVLGFSLSLVFAQTNAELAVQDRTMTVDAYAKKKTAGLVSKFSLNQATEKSVYKVFHRQARNLRDIAPYKADVIDYNRKLNSVKKITIRGLRKALRGQDVAAYLKTLEADLPVVVDHAYYKKTLDRLKEAGDQKEYSKVLKEYETLKKKYAQ